jgi:hypothetical protein
MAHVSAICQGRPSRRFERRCDTASGAALGSSYHIHVDYVDIIDVPNDSYDVAPSSFLRAHRGLRGATLFFLRLSSPIGCFHPRDLRATLFMRPPPSRTLLKRNADAPIIGDCPGYSSFCHFPIGSVAQCGTGLPHCGGPGSPGRPSRRCIPLFSPLYFPLLYFLVAKRRRVGSR